MTKITADTWDATRWPNFSAEEFRCSHCGQMHMEADFLDVLQRIRTAFGHAMVVSSGYRCPDHNIAVSSTGPSGPHTTGRAVDIAISGPAALELIRTALAEGITGLGVKQKGEGRFVHIDTLDGTARPGVWSY